MRRRLLGEKKKQLYSLTIKFTTGIASITVNGITYTSGTTLQFEEGSIINWSAVAAAGYTITEYNGRISMNGNKTLNPIPERYATFAVSWFYSSGKNVTDPILTVQTDSESSTVDKNTVTSLVNLGLIYVSTSSKRYVDEYGVSSSGDIYETTDGARIRNGYFIIYTFLVPQNMTSKISIEISGGYCTFTSDSYPEDDGGWHYIYSLGRRQTADVYKGASISPDVIPEGAAY